MQAEVRSFDTTVGTSHPRQYLLLPSELRVEMCGSENRTIHLRNDAF